MDLLARAAALAACPLFEELAPAALVRLAERASSAVLVRGERRTTEDTVWVVATGRLAVAVHAGENAEIATASMVRRRGRGAGPRDVLGMIRVVRATTPVIEVVAEDESELVALAVDDVRDVLEEDPAALAALADRLAALLLEGA